MRGCGYFLHFQEVVIMFKKFKFINAMSLILAVLAAIAIIVACGKGDVINSDKDDEEYQYIEDLIDKFQKEYLNSKEWMDSIGTAPSSSSIESSSSSYSAIGSSSSLPGSSSLPSSSSLSSSSVESLYRVECKVRDEAATGIEKTPIVAANRPEVKCIEKAKPSNVVVLNPINDVQWISAPAWPSPQLGTYSDIQVKIYDDAAACQELTAKCEGAITICPSTGCPSSSSVAVVSSSSVAAVSSSSVAAGSSSSVAAVSSSSRPSSSSIAPSSSSVAPTPTVTLTCTLPLTLTAGTAVDAATQRGYLRCSNNATPGIPTWIGNPRVPISGTTVAAAGSYNEIYATADCGNATGIMGQCNNVTIYYAATCTAPTGSPAGSGNYTIGANGVSVPVPTYSCTGASASSAKFTITDANDGPITLNTATPPVPPALDWNKTPAVAHPFYNTGDKRAIYMWRVSCGAQVQTYGDSTSKAGLIKCANDISIKAASSSSVAPSSSSVAPSSSSAAPNTYTVTYSANSGTGAPAAQTKTHDVALTLSTATPTRTGYTFDRWNTAANGSGTYYSAGSSYTANATVTLYAQWTANTYTVTYSANSGTGGPTTQTKTHDVALTLSTAVPTRTDYTFAGWNTVAAGTGTAYAAGASYTANAAVTLYAQWTAASACQYQPSWCGGSIAIGSVKVGEVPKSQNQDGPNACYFVQNITATSNIYGSSLINGENAELIKYLSGNNLTTKLPSQADGGYYIYIPRYAMFEATVTQATAISPNCK
jgi:uncharacterized repeat protein (TIGR02543 family)